MSDTADGFAELRRWHDATGHAHVTVLRWLGRWKVGYAQYGGTCRTLREPPGIDGEDIEYLGGNEGTIDGAKMTPEQLVAVHKLLVHMDTAAGDAMCGRGLALAVVGA